MAFIFPMGSYKMVKKARLVYPAIFSRNPAKVPSMGVMKKSWKSHGNMWETGNAAGSPMLPMNK